LRFYISVAVEKHCFLRILCGFSQMGTTKAHKNRYFWPYGLGNPCFQRGVASSGMSEEEMAAWDNELTETYL
jgi:hypothetical protein